jgi:hypothetical protein
MPRADEGEAFRVTAGGSLTYTVGDRLPGPVSGVENARLSYVVPSSGGFSIRHRDDPPGRWRACTWGRDPLFAQSAHVHRRSRRRCCRAARKKARQQQ